MSRPVILIAEPNLHLRQILTQAFTVLGFSAIPVENIEAARTALIGEQIDAAVIDLPLYPHLSAVELRHDQWTGLDLVREIRLLPFYAAIPILVLGTLETKDKRFRAKALDAGASEYLTKPFSIGIVTQFIAQARDHRAAS